MKALEKRIKGGSYCLELITKKGREAGSKERVGKFKKKMR